jgi:hypothetical protein
VTPEELLNETEIAHFVATHQGAVGERVRCASLCLAGKPDDLQALKKILPALDENVVRVFFSYKKKDEDVATKIMELLRIHSADKLQIISMADFERDIAGKPFREFIREEVQRANWFILLLPDPSDGWDWCLYEAGLFEAHNTSADRLICIHHPNTGVPSQIEEYQAVPAIIQDMEAFLRGIYIGEDPIPGMKALNHAIESKLRKLAEEIVSAIRAPRKSIIRQTFPAWVELRINQTHDLTDEHTLDQASIVACNDEALQLFHLLHNPRIWGRLRIHVAESDSRWREEICKTLKAITEGERFEPVQAVFKARNGKIYRPVACAVDRMGEDDGPIERFHVAFIEEVGVLDSASLPMKLSVLSSVLRFSFRFRWEVLEPFSREGMTEADITKLENALLRMRADWYSRGINDFSAVLQCFPTDKAARVREIMELWHTIRNSEGSGTLDIAIRDKDVEKIPCLLKGLIPKSQEFLELAADRFSVMVAGK